MFRGNGVCVILISGIPPVAPEDPPDEGMVPAEQSQAKRASVITSGNLTVSRSRRRSPYLFGLSAHQPHRSAALPGPPPRTRPSSLPLTRARATWPPPRA